MGANPPNGETNGKANGNGHTNGNGKANGKGPYFRTRADCFIAYREGYSLRWIADHCQFGRGQLAKWRDELDWDKQVAEMDEERIKLYEASCAAFDVQAIDKLQGMFNLVVTALAHKMRVTGNVYSKDLKIVVDCYKDIRQLNAHSVGADIGAIEQRVTVSLDPDEDDSDE